MRYQITHKTTYEYGERISTCHNQVHLAPRNTSWQSCDHHRLLVRPEPTNLDHRTDYFGNRIDYFAILRPHSRLTVKSVCRVTVNSSTPDLTGSPAWEEMVEQLRVDRSSQVLDARQFIYSSPRIPVQANSGRLKSPSGNGESKPGKTSFADEIRDYTSTSFVENLSLVDAVLDLTRRINEDFVFDGKATTLNTPVVDAFRQRRGVCQDFAHIQIACLRSLGIAARYVSGYLRTVPPPGRPRLVGADASHAWVSVYCGKLGWLDFDPTNNVIPGDSHITVAWGRDYDDVCPIQGVFLGGGRQTMTTSVDVIPESP